MFHILCSYQKELNDLLQIPLAECPLGFWFGMGFFVECRKKNLIAGNTGYEDSKLLMSVHNGITPSTQNLESVENREECPSGLCNC